MKSKVSRRNFMQWGLGLGASVAAGPVAAQVCNNLETPGQGLGPFFPRPNTPADPIREDIDPNTPIFLANDSDLTKVKGRSGQADGQVVYIKGKVSNTHCQPVKGATVIIWQASSSGRYNHTQDSNNHDFLHPKTGETIDRVLDSKFQYWGKAITDDNGNYMFKTIVPGFYPADLQGGWYRPPHIHFMVAATGYPQFVTQMYFRGDEIKNNKFVQELNKKDLLLHGQSMSSAESEQLIVDFKKDKALADQLSGEFNINLKR